VGDFSDERFAIEDRFSIGWGSTTPVRFENDGSAAPVALPSVALVIRDGRGDAVTLGPYPLHRFVGVVITQIFVAEGTGHAQLRAYADQVAAIWRDGVGRGAQITAGTNSTLTFWTPYFEMAGPRTGYLQGNVTVPFYRDVIYV
jgi:hypothetical protein